MEIKKCRHTSKKQSLLAKEAIHVFPTHFEVILYQKLAVVSSLIENENLNSLTLFSNPAWFYLGKM